LETDRYIVTHALLRRDTAHFAEPDLPALAVYNIGRSFAKAPSPITTTTGIITHTPGFTF
jgi:hypothetical protein